MKETYFTGKNIGKISGKILKEISGYIKKGWQYKASNSALIVTDMQDYFLKKESHAFIPSAPAIVPNIKKLTEACRDYDIPVIFTRHVNNKTNAGMMAEWWSEVITKDNPLSIISEEFDKTKCTIIIKPQYDAFFATTLHQVLKAKGVDRLVITGVMTHLCCETTARSAFVHGYEVYIPVDATATYNRELHTGSMRSIATGFGIPLLTEDILEKIEDPAGDN